MTLKLEDFEPEFWERKGYIYDEKPECHTSYQKLYTAYQMQRVIDQCNAKDVEIARLKTVPMRYRRMEFNAQLQDEVTGLEGQLAVAQAENERLRNALHRISSWELPSTGEFWDGDITRPISFETNYGSQGAKAHIRNIANEALATTPPSDALREHDAKLVERIADFVGNINATQENYVNGFGIIADKIRKGEF